MITKKVCMLGNNGVGKTSIVLKRIKNYFAESYLPTLGCDFYELDEEPDKEGNEEPELKLLIWDIAGQETFSKLQDKYLSAASVCIIVIDHQRHSSKYIRPWIEKMEKFSEKDAECIFALNKADLIIDMQEYKEQALEIEKEYGRICMPTSAKSGLNTHRLFDKAVELIKKNI